MFIILMSIAAIPKVKRAAAPLKNRNSHGAHAILNLANATQSYEC